MWFVWFGHNVLDKQPVLEWFISVSELRLHGLLPCWFVIHSSILYANIEAKAYKDYNYEAEIIDVKPYNCKNHWFIFEYSREFESGSLRLFACNFMHITTFRRILLNTIGFILAMHK